MGSETRRRRLARLAERYGVRVVDRAVCRGHAAPMDFLESWVYDRPSASLVLGPRGGGKSFLSALGTHLDSVVYPGHGTRILGGSLAQSEQIYNALVGFDGLRPEDELIHSITRTRAVYCTGSDVSILAASKTSVRGPHVPTLRLDEVDEIERDIRDAALGMCVSRDGVPAMAAMTSTWHNVGGPMGELIERSQAGELPLYTFCIFDVLERCPDERSGPNLERCPECPLMPWCHSDLDDVGHSGGLPKAKRSAGHYAIEALAQKVRIVGRNTFEADYLCSGPKADGIWFTRFDQAIHVADEAEYDPSLPVHLAIDSGVHTGAVWFQVDRSAPVDEVRVFADYYAYDLGAEAAALGILAVGEERCGGRRDVTSTDPAGRSRTSVGPTVLGEYERAGIDRLATWPVSSVADGLALIESFLSPADGIPRLLVHPRCGHLIRAFRAYRRAKRGTQWLGHPEEPQHPHEDLMDALRGGLVNVYPDGRRPELALPRRPFSQVF